MYGVLIHFPLRSIPTPHSCHHLQNLRSRVTQDGLDEMRKQERANSLTIVFSCQVNCVICIFPFKMTDLLFIYLFHLFITFVFHPSRERAIYGGRVELVLFFVLFLTINGEMK